MEEKNQNQTVQKELVKSFQQQQQNENSQSDLTIDVEEKEIQFEFQLSNKSSDFKDFVNQWHDYNNMDDSDVKCQVEQNLKLQQIIQDTYEKQQSIYCPKQQLKFENFIECEQIDHFKVELSLLEEYIECFIDLKDKKINQQTEQIKFYKKFSKLNFYSSYDEFLEQLFKNYFFVLLEKEDMKKKYQIFQQEQKKKINAFDLSYVQFLKKNLITINDELQKQATQFIKQNIIDIKVSYLTKDFNTLFLEFNQISNSLYFNPSEILQLKAKQMGIPLSENKDQKNSEDNTELNKSNNKIEEIKILIESYFLIKKKSFIEGFVLLYNFSTTKNIQLKCFNLIYLNMIYCIEQLKVIQKEESDFCQYLLSEKPIQKNAAEQFQTQLFFQNMNIQETEQFIVKNTQEYKDQFNQVYYQNNHIITQPLCMKKDNDNNSSQFNNLNLQINNQNNNHNNDNNNQNNNVNNNQQNQNENVIIPQIMNAHVINKEGNQNKYKILSLQETGLRIIPILYQLELLEKASIKQCDDIFDFIVANSDCGFIALLLRQKRQVCEILDFVLNSIKKLSPNNFSWASFFLSCFQKRSYSLNLDFNVLFEKSEKFSGIDKNIMIVSCQVDNNGLTKPVCFVKYKKESNQRVKKILRMFEITQQSENQNQYTLEFSGDDQEKYSCFEEAPLIQIAKISSASYFINPENKFQFEYLHNDFENSIFVNGNLVFENLNYIVLQFLQKIGDINDFSNHYILSLGNKEVNYQIQENNRIIQYKVPEKISDLGEEIQIQQWQNTKQNLYHAHIILQKRLVQCFLKDIDFHPKQSFQRFFEWSRNYHNYIIKQENANIFFTCQNDFIIQPLFEVVHQQSFQDINDYINNNQEHFQELSNFIIELRDVKQIYKSQQPFKQLKQKLDNLYFELLKDQQQPLNSNLDANGNFDELFKFFAKIFKKKF